MTFAVQRLWGGLLGLMLVLPSSGVAAPPTPTNTPLPPQVVADPLEGTLTKLRLRETTQQILDSLYPHYEEVKLGLYTVTDAGQWSTILDHYQTLLRAEGYHPWDDTVYTPEGAQQAAWIKTQFFTERVFVITLIRIDPPAQGPTQRFLAVMSGQS